MERDTAVESLFPALDPVSRNFMAGAEIDFALGAGQEPPNEEVPEPPAEPRTQRGDVWVLGPHRLGCGDARDAKFIAKVMDGAIASVAFLDPPYNVPIANHAYVRSDHREFALATGAMSAATGFYSTAGDLCRYASAHFLGNEELLTVGDGMLLRPGTGSTAYHFITGLRYLPARGIRLSGVAAARAGGELARRAGVEIVSDWAPLARRLDLAVDGADEIAPDLNLVKGLGGAMFREKLVALSAERFVIIADVSKLVGRLGVGVVPVEVAPFLWHQTARRLAEFGAAWVLRGGGEQPFLTDNGNLVLDLSFAGGLGEPERMGSELKAIPGVIEHGLFCGLARAAIVGASDGVRVMGSLD